MSASASPLEDHDAPTADRRNGKALAAFILGIIAVVGALLPIAGWILGIVAIVLATERTARARSCRPSADGLPERERANLSVAPEVSRRRGGRGDEPARGIRSQLA
jgi:hypothetical protein